MFLPFLPRFGPAILAGVKVMTTRSRAYGQAGDILDTPFGPVRLVEVRRVTLHEVATQYWREEGVSSPQEFAAIWREIHPGRGYNPGDRKVLHRFEILDASPAQKPTNAPELHTNRRNA